MGRIRHFTATTTDAAGAAQPFAAAAPSGSIRYLTVSKAAILAIMERNATLNFQYMEATLDTDAVSAGFVVERVAIQSADLSSDRAGSELVYKDTAMQWPDFIAMFNLEAAKSQRASEMSFRAEFGFRMAITYANPNAAWTPVMRCRFGNSHFDVGKDFVDEVGAQGDFSPSECETARACMGRYSLVMFKGSGNACETACSELFLSQHSVGHCIESFSAVIGKPPTQHNAYLGCFRVCNSGCGVKLSALFSPGLGTAVGAIGNFDPRP